MGTVSKRLSKNYLTIYNHLLTKKQKKSYLLKLKIPFSFTFLNHYGIEQKHKYKKVSFIALVLLVTTGGVI